MPWETLFPCQRRSFRTFQSCFRNQPCAAAGQPVSDCAGEHFLQHVGRAVYFFRNDRAAAEFFVAETFAYREYRGVGNHSRHVPLGYFVIRKRLKFVSGPMTWIYGRGIAKAWMEKGIPGARALEDRIYGFYEQNSRRCLAIFLLELCFHAAGVTEIYVC